MCQERLNNWQRVYHRRKAQGRGMPGLRHSVPCANVLQVGVEHIDAKAFEEGRSEPAHYHHDCPALFGYAETWRQFREAGAPAAIVEMAAKRAMELLAADHMAEAMSYDVAAGYVSDEEMPVETAAPGDEKKDPSDASAINAPSPAAPSAAPAPAAPVAPGAAASGGDAAPAAGAPALPGAQHGSRPGAWSPQETRLLLELKGAGMPYNKIAEHVNHTAPACRSHWHRTTTKSNPSP
ncbi:hypothetical protein OQA88_9727 [Cercophora sp. LCS_1]